MPESMTISCYHRRYSRDRQWVCACHPLLCCSEYGLDYCAYNYVEFTYLTLRTHQTGYDRRTHYVSLGPLKKSPGKPDKVRTYVLMLPGWRLRFI